MLMEKYSGLLEHEAQSEKSMGGCFGAAFIEFSRPSLGSKREIRGKSNLPVNSWLFTAEFRERERIRAECGPPPTVEYRKARVLELTSARSRRFKMHTDMEKLGSKLKTPLLLSLFKKILTSPPFESSES